MTFIRSKKIKRKLYYYIVESYWESGRPHQRVCLYLGTADALLLRLKKR
jgi:hypothetical protein